MIVKIGCGTDGALHSTRYLSVRVGSVSTKPPVTLAGVAQLCSRQVPVAGCSLPVLARASAMPTAGSWRVPFKGNVRCLVELERRSIRSPKVRNHGEGPY